MRVHLDERLRTIAGLVRPDRKIADIGTDHAFVPCWLWQQGAREIFATDISEGPLSRAKSTARLYGIDGIRFMLCDGLDGVPPVDDVIIAGMGGEMIGDIISRCKFLNSEMHFILQPMTKDHLLRYTLYRMGLEIISEKTAVAGRKVYTVMLCGYSGRAQNIDGRFAFTGKNTDRAYHEKIAAKLAKMGKRDEYYLKLREEILREDKHTFPEKI